MSAQNAVRAVFFQPRAHFFPIFLFNPFLGLICLKNEPFQRFEPVCFAALQLVELLLDSGFNRHEWILQFLEFFDFKRTVCKGGIEPVNLGFDLGQFAFDPFNLRLSLIGNFRFPCFDAGGELLEPLVGNGNHEGVPLNLRLKNLIAYECASIAMLFLVLVSAAIVVILATASLAMALARDAITARTARCEIQKPESFFGAFFAAFAGAIVPGWCGK